MITWLLHDAQEIYSNIKQMKQIKQNQQKLPLFVIVVPTHDAYYCFKLSYYDEYLRHCLYRKHIPQRDEELQQICVVFKHICNV